MKKRQFLFIFIALQVLTNCKKEIKNPVYQYYPMNINNEWVYAINNFYGGLDTLHIKVIGKDVYKRQILYCIPYRIRKKDDKTCKAPPVHSDA